MANRPHVPKFGDWSNQDQPFTAVFDNARNNKRQDLYESFDQKVETKPHQDNEAPLPPPRKPEPSKPVKEEEKPKVKAPPPDQLYGGGGLYGGYGGGSDGNHHKPPQAPRTVQPKNPRGGNNGRAPTTIPPFPGSLGEGENMSYTHIFEQAKDERNHVGVGGGRSYGGTANNSPSRPINGSAPTKSKICCFPWF